MPLSCPAILPIASASELQPTVLYRKTSGISCCNTPQPLLFKQSERLEQHFEVVVGLTLWYGAPVRLLLSTKRVDGTWKADSGFLMGCQFVQFGNTRSLPQTNGLLQFFWIRSRYGLGLSLATVWPSFLDAGCIQPFD